MTASAPDTHGTMPVTPQTLRNVVGGDDVEASGEARTGIVDPPTGRVVATAPVSIESRADEFVHLEAT